MLQIIAFHVSIHLLTYYLVVHLFAKGHLQNRHNKLVNEKYAPFVRNDLDKWSAIWCFPFYITFWPRFLLACLNIMVTAILVLLLMTGVNIENPEIRNTRKTLIGWVLRCTCRFHCLIGGLVWCKVEQISTEEGDYT